MSLRKRKYTNDSASSLIKRNAGSLTLIIVGLVNIIIQLLMPDAVPDIILTQIQNTASSGMVSLYTLFLYLWLFGGFALVFCGMAIIVVKIFRS
jgi:hypothetical protein